MISAASRVDAASRPQAVETAHALEALVTWLRDSREPVDISKSALSALSRLDVRGPMRVTDLAEREGMTQPGMTTLVKRLVTAGFAERGHDPADGRAVVVALTDAGRQRLADYRVSRTETIIARLEQLDDDAREALARAVPALRLFVEEEE